MVGEMRPELPERELPDDFDFVWLPAAGLTPVVRDELAGKTAVPAEGPVLSGAIGVNSISRDEFDLPYPGAHDPPSCRQAGHEFDGWP